MIKLYFKKCKIVWAVQTAKNLKCSPQSPVFYKRKGLPGPPPGGLFSPNKIQFENDPYEKLWYLENVEYAPPRPLRVKNPEIKNDKI